MSTLAERIDVLFRSGDARCAGWLYPAGSADAPAPCVVMGHGFGALKEGRLAAYAERFQRNGFVALAFDYRHFGASTGQPRQLLDIRSQLADWAAATDYARGLECVDADRIIVWGSSFGGGHVIKVAARDPRIVAAIAQVPHASGPAAARAAGASANLRMAAAAVRDALGVLLRRPPYYAPIVGPPGTLGAMTSPDSLPGYRAMYPDGFSWRNEIAARVLLSTAMYSPGRAAARVLCPLLVQVALRDVVTPPGPAERAAHRAVRGELVCYPIGHFDIYVGEPFERAVADQLSFLAHHVRSARS